MEIRHRDNRNLIIALSGEENFSLTGYKVLMNRGGEGFVECRKVLLNGKPHFWYDIAAYESFGKLMPGLKQGQPGVILHNMAGIICRTETNGFLDIGNILMNPSDIFVDPDTLDVYLIYLPVTGRGPVDRAAAVGELLNEVERLKTGNDAIKEELSCLWTPGSFEELEKATDFSAGPAYKAGTGGMARQIHTGGEDANTDDFEETDRLVPQDGTSKGRRLGRLFGRKGKKTRVSGDAAETSMPESLEEEAQVQPPVSGPGKQDILILSGTSAGRMLTFCIDSDSFKLGKKEEAVDGCIDTSPAVSRIHCEIQRRDGEFYIHDLESANGTFVNGIRLNAGREFRLHRGDKLRLADVELGVL